MQRRSALLLAAVLMAVSFALPAYSAEGGGTLDDCLHMDIGDIMAHAGEDVMVPITISQTTGWGVMAFEMTICWCDLPAGLLQYTGCKGGPVMGLTGGWTAPACGPCGPNCISVAAAGTKPLVGEGVLMYLTFHVSANAKPCMCCEIKFEEIKLYDPEDPLNVCSTDGKVCIESCTVFGGVALWWCEYDDCGDPTFTHMLPGVRAHLSRCGEPIATDYTNQDGFVLFDCLEALDEQDLVQCGYCLDVDYCPIPRDWINAFDAALILKYLVCIDQLACCSFVYCPENPSIGGETIYPQRLAGDVNCTGVLTAYDASLILQYVVGLLPAFPCPDPWVFMRLGNCDECQFRCPAIFPFIALLKGDVSGECYVRPATFAVPTAKVKIGVPTHFDGYVEVPVGVKHADNVFSTQFELAYNADDFDVTEVRGIGLASGMMTAYNADNGNLLIAMAGSGSFSGSGDVAIITLQKKHTPIPVASTRLEIVSALLNESAPMIEDHQYDLEVVRFVLGPVSPNPFTEAAVISFSAPRATGVSIDVYDVNGRLVQTVLSGQVEAGTHQVSWDGRDSSGSKVARGVYFCRMNAGEFSATEKMVMLQ
jgi:hypothetical protein